MGPWGRSREVEKVKQPAQQSIASLPEHQQDAAMSKVDHANETYPPVELPTGQSLHVHCHNGEWDVWLNCEESTFTGLCIVAGAPTREEAVRMAVAVFEAAEAELQSERSARG